MGTRRPMSRWGVLTAIAAGAVAFVFCAGPSAPPPRTPAPVAPSPVAVAPAPAAPIVHASPPAEPDPPAGSELEEAMLELIGPVVATCVLSEDPHPAGLGRLVGVGSGALTAVAVGTELLIHASADMPDVVVGVLHFRGYAPVEVAIDLTVAPPATACDGTVVLEPSDRLVVGHVDAEGFVMASGCGGRDGSPDGRFVVEAVPGPCTVRVVELREGGVLLGASVAVRVPERGDVDLGEVELLPVDLDALNAQVAAVEGAYRAALVRGRGVVVSGEWGDLTLGELRDLWREELGIDTHALVVPVRIDGTLGRLRVDPGRLLGN